MPIVGPVDSCLFSAQVGLIL